MVKGPINPKITSLGDKLWSVARKQKFTITIKGKNRKMSIKSVKMKISKTKKCISFSCPKDHSTQKLGQKVCHVARGHTDRQTDKHTHTRVTTFRVSGVFRSLNPSLDCCKTNLKNYLKDSPGSVEVQICALFATKNSNEKCFFAPIIFYANHTFQ